jgi:hypothetical protein
MRRTISLCSVAAAALRLRLRWRLPTLVFALAAVPALAAQTGELGGIVVDDAR